MSLKQKIRTIAGIGAIALAGFSTIAGCGGEEERRHTEAASENDRLADSLPIKDEYPKLKIRFMFPSPQEKTAQELGLTDETFQYYKDIKMPRRCIDSVLDWEAIKKEGTKAYGRYKAVHRIVLEELTPAEVRKLYDTKVSPQELTEFMRINERYNNQVDTDAVLKLKEKGYLAIDVRKVLEYEERARESEIYKIINRDRSP